jgi:hypothetical protein
MNDRRNGFDLTCEPLCMPDARVRELPRVPIAVPESGVVIKEDARVLTVY